MFHTNIALLGLVLFLLFSFSQCNQLSDTDAEDAATPAAGLALPIANIADTNKKIRRFQDEETGKFGYKNQAGEVITEPVFDGAMAYINTPRIRVMKAGKFGFVNEEGQLTIPPRFAQAQAFTEDYAAVQMDGKWGYIDLNGNIAVAPTYQQAQAFRSGMAAVMQDGKWGYINTTGRMVIPTKYQRTAYFSSRLAPVMQGGKWGYINLEDKEIIAFQYDWAAAFDEVHKGMARVAIGSKTFFINAKGKCVKDCEKY